MALGVYHLGGRGPFPDSAATTEDGEINEDELEEERRLMYVAATRAKENLFISYPINDIFDRATGMVLSKPSRFLEDIPRRILKPVFPH